MKNSQIPEFLQNGTPQTITYQSYYLLNPAYDIRIALRLLGDNANNTMIVKGTPSDFASNPCEVFRKVESPKTLRIKH